MVSNPFDWRNSPKRIDMSDVAKAARNSYQQTAVVNRRRAQGIEPCSVHLPGSRDDGPKRFVAEMPEMSKHDRNAARRSRRAEKRKNT